MISIVKEPQISIQNDLVNNISVHVQCFAKCTTNRSVVRRKTHTKSIHDEIIINEMAVKLIWLIVKIYFVATGRAIDCYQCVSANNTDESGRGCRNPFDQWNVPYIKKCHQHIAGHPQEAFACVKIVQRIGRWSMNAFNTLHQQWLFDSKANEQVWRQTERQFSNCNSTQLVSEK